MVSPRFGSSTRHPLRRRAIRGARRKRQAGRDEPLTAGGPARRQQGHAHTDDHRDRGENSSMAASSDSLVSLFVLEVKGSLRAPATSALRHRVHDRLRFGERRLLLDLSRLADIDAAGVGELVHVFNTMRAAGGVLQIAEARKRVRRLLDVAGVWRPLSAAQIDPRNGPIA